MANNMVSHWCGIVFDSFKDSVVRLDSEQHFQGNGFVVYVNSNTCLILTCEHVCPKSNGNVVVGSTMNAWFHTAVRLDARVVYVDKDRDLALLRADGIAVSCTPISFWEDGTAVTGIDVVLLSFFTMKYGQVLVEPGTFPGKIISEPVWIDRIRSEEIRSDYTSFPGTSGAPVFLQRVNKVVGVNSGAFHGPTKISISVRTVHETLREWLHIGDGNITIEEMLERIAKQ